MLRLDVGRSSIVFDRMRAAIGRLGCNINSQESSPEADASDREYILQGTRLRDVLLHSFRLSNSVAADAAPDEHFSPLPEKPDSGAQQEGEQSEKGGKPV